MHYAMYNGHARLVNKLVKFEADDGILKEMETSQGKKPFNLAKDDKVKFALN